MAPVVKEPVRVSDDDRMKALRIYLSDDNYSIIEIAKEHTDSDFFEADLENEHGESRSRSYAVYTADEAIFAARETLRDSFEDWNYEKLKELDDQTLESCIDKNLWVDKQLLMCQANGGLGELLNHHDHTEVEVNTTSGFLFIYRIE